MTNAPWVIPMMNSPWLIPVFPPQLPWEGCDDGNTHIITSLRLGEAAPSQAGKVCLSRPVAVAGIQNLQVPRSELSPSRSPKLPAITAEKSSPSPRAHPGGSGGFPLQADSERHKRPWCVKLPGIINDSWVLSNHYVLRNPHFCD